LNLGHPGMLPTPTPFWPDAVDDKDHFEKIVPKVNGMLDPLIEAKLPRAAISGSSGSRVAHLYIRF